MAVRGHGHKPSLLTRFVAILQWAATAYLLSIPVSGLVVARTDLGGETLGDVGLVVTGAAGAAGLLWVQFRTPGPAAEAAVHRKRVEYLFDLVLWVALTTVVTIVAIVAGFSAFAQPFVFVAAGGVVAAYLVAYALEVELYHPLARSLSGLVRRARQFVGPPT